MKWTSLIKINPDGIKHAFEYFVALMLLSWAVSFVIDDGMYDLYTYSYLDDFGPPYFWATIFLFLGLIIIKGAGKECSRWRSYVGMSMCLSGFLWTLISIGFILTYPPYSSVMITYPVLAIFSYLVGFGVLDEAKHCRRRENDRL